MEITSSKLSKITAQSKQENRPQKLQLSFYQVIHASDLLKGIEKALTHISQLLVKRFITPLSAKMLTYRNNQGYVMAVCVACLSPE